MDRTFSQYAHLATLIADVDEGPSHVFDSSVTYGKAIIDAFFPSESLVHQALNLMYDTLRGLPG